MGYRIAELEMQVALLAKQVADLQLVTNILSKQLKVTEDYICQEEHNKYLS